MSTETFATRFASDFANTATPTLSGLTQTPLWLLPRCATRPPGPLAQAEDPTHRAAPRSVLRSSGRGPDPGELLSPGCTVAKGTAGRGSSNRRPGLSPCPPPTCTGRRGPHTRPAAFVRLRGHPGADTGRAEAQGHSPAAAGARLGRCRRGHGPDPTEGPKSSRRPTPAWGAAGSGPGGAGRGGRSRSQPQAGEGAPRAGSGRGLEAVCPWVPGAGSGRVRDPGPRHGDRGTGAGRTPVCGAARARGGGAPHRDRCLRRSRCRSSGPAGTCSRL